MFTSHRFDLKYVQVVNSPGTYGEEAAAELVKHARQSGVCVAQTVTLPSRDLTRESADRVVQVCTSFKDITTFLLLDITAVVLKARRLI